MYSALGFFRKHKTFLFSIGFLVLFSITVSYANPPTSPYTPGATLDPQCAPGSSNCYVSVSSGGANYSGTGTPSFQAIGGTASGNYSVAFGNNTSAVGLNSTAFGYGTYAYGTTATTFGNETEADGDNSTAFGNYTYANGQNAAVFGDNTSGSSFDSTTIGALNIGGGNPTSWVATDPLFEVGNGGDGGSDGNPNASGPSDAFEVLKNGDTTVGGNLTVNGTSTSTSSGGLAAPTNATATADENGDGDYTYDSSSYTYKIYAYTLVNGTREYSSTYATVQGPNDTSGSPYSIDLSWNAVPGATGYRVIVNYGGFYNYGDDTTTNSIIDDDQDGDQGLDFQYGSQYTTVTPVDTNGTTTTVFGNNIFGGLNIDDGINITGIESSGSGSALAAPTNFTATADENDSDGDYSGDSTNITYKIYSYTLVNGTREYSSDYATVTGPDYTTDNNNYSIDLSWTAAPGATGYRVIAGTTSSGGDKPVIGNFGGYDTTSTSLIDNDANDCGVGACFTNTNGAKTVTPVDTGSGGSYTNANIINGSVTLSGNSIFDGSGNLGIGTLSPSAPLDVTGEAMLGSLDVTGTGSGGIPTPTGGAITFNYASSNGSGSSSLIDGDYSADGDTWTYKIYALTGTCSGSGSNGCHPSNATYSAPETVTATDNNSGDIYNVDLSWTAVPGATAYRIIRSDTDGQVTAGYGFTTTSTSLVDDDGTSSSFRGGMFGPQYTTVTPTSSVTYTNTNTINGNTTLGGNVNITGTLTCGGISCTGGSNITLQTNSTNNGSQSLLNLVNGNGISVSDDGSGDISISFNNEANGGTASGFDSIALGYNTIANTNYTTAMGNHTTASGSVATAFGDTTTASGGDSTSFGASTTASGEFSTAFGASTTASGYGSTAFGASTTASGNVATAFGVDTQANAFASTAFGFDNIGGGNQYATWVPTDPLFEVGNGGDTSGQSGVNPSHQTSDALMILKNGDIGIDLSHSSPYPTQALEVNGNIKIDTVGNGIYFPDGSFMSTATGGSGVGTSSTTDVDLNADTDQNGSGVISFATHGSGRMTIANNGSIGIGTTTPSQLLDIEGGNLYVSGNITCGGTCGPVFKTNSVANGSQALLNLVAGSNISLTDNGSGSITIGGDTGTGVPSFQALAGNASGSNSISIGANTIANNQYAIAIGDGAHATGLVAFAFGHSTTASGNGATAFGDNTVASGYGATAFGEAATASGQYSTSFGNGANASGYGSVAFGDGTLAASIDTTSIGSYNVGGGDPLNRVGTDPVFEVGNGLGSNRSDALVVLKNGNVGIGLAAGTDNPGYLLTVGSSSTTTGTAVAQFQNAGGTCTITPSVTGGISCTSDMNLKKNIVNLSDNSTWSFNNNITPDNQTILADIMALKPVDYNWNVEADGTQKHAGFIAQEVQQVFPDLVHTDPNTNLLSLDYTGLVPYTVEALQEMNFNITNIDDLTKTNTWRDALEAWFADSANGIQSFFSGTITTNNLCVGTTCVTQQQFLQMVQNSSGNNSSTTTVISGGSSSDSTSDTSDSAASSDSSTSTSTSSYAQTPDAAAPVITTTTPSSDSTADTSDDATQSPDVAPAAPSTAGSD